MSEDRASYVTQDKPAIVLPSRTHDESPGTQTSQTSVGWFGLFEYLGTSGSQEFYYLVEQDLLSEDRAQSDNKYLRKIHSFLQWMPLCNLIPVKSWNNFLLDVCSEAVARSELEKSKPHGLYIMTYAATEA